MKTASDLFNFFRRQGTNRLRPLLLLLETPRDTYLPVHDLETVHVQRYRAPLQSWDLHVNLKHGLLEFKQLSSSAWIFIGDYLKGRLYDLNPDSQNVYHTDSIRITPSLYTFIQENREYLLFRSTFHLYPRPQLLHKEIHDLPIESLLRIGLNLYRFYGTTHTVSFKEAAKLLNTGFLATWDEIFTPLQVAEAIPKLHCSSKESFQIHGITSTDFVLSFPSS